MEYKRYYLVDCYNCGEYVVSTYVKENPGRCVKCHFEGKNPLVKVIGIDKGQYYEWIDLMYRKYPNIKSIRNISIRNIL
jgi:hypothetical protein